jgi:tetratricopeptide (TPR) repeat protein
MGLCESVGGLHIDAVARGRRAVELDPNSYLAHWSLTEALSHAGRYEEAVVSAERAIAISGRHSWVAGGLAGIYAGWGKAAEAKRVFADMQERESREYLQPTMMAYAASSAGEMDQAVAYADRAERDRDPLFGLLARSWPEFEALRDDSRFRTIVDRLHLPGLAWS